MRTAALLIALFALQPAPTPEDRLWHHRNLGKAFYENPTTQAQAVEEFRKALALAPDSTREQLNYSLALLRAGKQAEAVPILQKVQQLDPKLPHTYFNLGITYKKEGEFDKATAQFEKMLKLTPNEPIAHYNLGVLYKAADRMPDAIREFQAAARLNPNLAAPHFQLYNAFRTSQRAADAARELAEFQRLKKLQEGASIPEDVEWCDYAEVYDPVTALPPQTAATPRYTEQPAARPPGTAALREWKSVAPGDFNNDGLLDLAVITGTGAHLCRNNKGSYACNVLAQGSYHAALWIDYDHDYDLDLILTGPQSKLFRNQGTAGFQDHTADFPFAAGASTRIYLTRVDPDSKAFDVVIHHDSRALLYRDLLNGRYRLDTAATAPTTQADPLAESIAYDASGAARRRIPQRPASWITVQLTGVKNLKLAQGSLVEVRAGLLHETKFYHGVPLLFDLRGYKEADTVRITWPNGLIQNEIHQAANKAYQYKEAQRLSGSCPMIWTWNGREFQFLTDVLGVAPLGASSGDGSYFPVDHDEYVIVPHGALSAIDGKLEIRVTEELSEVTYLDEFKLLAVDAPSKTELFLNEKWKSPPFADFRFFGVKRRVYPVSARSGNADALALIRKLDQRYPVNFKRTEAGVAEMHTLTLDFGRAAKDNRAVLILNGWVDWADGSTFRSASQESKDGLVPPYLQVRNHKGDWQTVIEDMGLPDGKPKTIAVNLTGKFLSGAREVRIVTNMSVYWDEIFLSESSDAPDVRQTGMPAISAALQFRGFSKAEIHPLRQQPERFSYANPSPVSFWNPTPGMYTRYGDVLPLLHSPDDRFVIMGSGDELRVRFDASQLPLVPQGWSRQYMIKVDGWAKDRDANTAHSQTVEPLPFHGMSRYPYGANEHFPDDESHREYRRQYNTRPALRLLRPLSQRGKPQ
ncbi:MAG: tetratricopeptide repeat protein [Acidobacteria bacterium]|nr:tetratricopeptide repeat protein [Acidobacteriota bacterium]